MLASWPISGQLTFSRDGKTFKKPRRPFEKERLDAELKLMVLSKIRNAARTLLTLEEKDPKRMFEGEALMRRMYKYGLLNESQDKLDYVLALSPQDFLERRLQTLVFKDLSVAGPVSLSPGVGKQMVNIPSFMVRVDSQKHIDFALTSPFGGGRPGRVKRKSLA
eukprot:gene3925-4179_t